ncbi:MAG: hypothetical protein MUP45_04670 [Candidatus Marinimicrobia bacterium]|nr:hypothetical protein [Candidatus Neomarinimicrobiota bacterium]
MAFNEKVISSFFPHLLTVARQKVSEEFVEVKAMRIEGGRVKMRRG